MSVNDLVLVQGMRDTKLALARWNDEPGAVLRPLAASERRHLGGPAVRRLRGGQADAAGLHDLRDPGRDPRTRPSADYGHVLFRNSLVLALHALACVAGFMAGSSLPLSASHRSGLSRWVHEKAGPLAIGFVVCATLFSLGTQAFVIGGSAASQATQLGTSPGILLLALAPHALPELIALFLPLAAWMIASRRDDWHELLAATVVTVAIAVPVLLAAAAVETWVSPAPAGRDRVLKADGAARRPPR